MGFSENVYGSRRGRRFAEIIRLNQINDHIFYYVVEKSLFDKTNRKERRQGFSKSSSIKKTQRRSLSTRKKPSKSNMFRLLACCWKSGSGFRVGLLAPKLTTWGRKTLKNALIKAFYKMPFNESKIPIKILIKDNYQIKSNQRPHRLFTNYVIEKSSFEKTIRKE